MTDGSAGMTWVRRESCDVRHRPGPALPPRAYPACLLRSHTPLSSGTKGAVDSCLRRNDVGLAGMTREVQE